MLRFLALFLLHTSLSSAFAEFDANMVSNSVEGKGVTFEMDPTKQGLRYLNLDEEENVARGTASVGDLEGVGASSTAKAGQGRSEETHPKFLVPAILAIHAVDIGAANVVAGSLSPILVAGNATEFDKPKKFMSNRPVGRRDGSGGANLGRELGTVTLSGMEDTTTGKYVEGSRPVRHHMAGPDKNRPGTLREIPLPKASLEVNGYQADLPEKQNTNRPTTRTGRGRGNSRELYPAHPDAP